MRLPVALLAGLLLVPLVAGCLGGSPPPTQPTGPTGPAAPPPAPEPAPLPPPPPPVPVPQRVSFAGASNEVSIAVDPSNTNRVLIGAKDYSLFFEPPCPAQNVWSGVYVSSDGGRLFRHTVLPGFKFDQRPSVMAGYRCTSDPVVAFDSKGMAYYVGLAFGYANATGPAPEPPPVPVPIPAPPVPPPQPPNGTNVTVPEPPAPSMVFLFTSKDGGLTWDQGHVVMEDKSGAIFQDKEALAIDASGAIYVAWVMETGPPTPALPGQVPSPPASAPSAPVLVVSKSSDGGATWSRPVPLEATPPIAIGSSVALAVVQGKVVAVFLGTLPTGDVQLFAAVSTDQAQTFTPAQAIGPVKPIPSPLPNSQFRAATEPAVAVDPVTNKILVAWNDAGGGTSDILVASSGDGATWSKPKVAHNSTDNDQFFPAISVSPQGVTWLAFYDRRVDPANKLIGVTIAQSPDDGATWNETRVAQAPFDGDKSLHQNGTPFLGDYIGISAAGNATWASWTATPLGRGDVFAYKASG